MTEKRLRYTFFVIFVLALLLPAYELKVVGNDWQWSHMPGWLCFIGAPLQWHLSSFAWLANPISIFALFSKSRKVRVSFSIFALLLSVLSYTLLGETTRLGPGGSTERFESFQIGFYLWVFCLSIPLLITEKKAKLS